MPQNARRFWKKLLSSALKPGILRKLRFSSFGLGDSSYAQYNVSHRLLCGRLSQLGAQSFCERGEGNEQHPEGHSAGFREWIVLLEQKLLDVFPLPDDVEVIAEDVFIEPKWKLIRNTADPDPYANGQYTGNHRSNSAAHAAPSPDPLPVINAYAATIARNDRITAKDHFQDVRLLDLRVQESVPYGPGAVAVIYPKNFPEDVQAFIELMRWHDIADVPLSLITNQSLSANELATPSPLRHIDLSTIRLTLRWLLENVLDIMSIPRRSFFAGLARFAGTRTEDEDYQKERLLELANPQLIDELWDYTTRPKRTILEAMTDFTLIKIPWQYALTAIPIMRGRQFSIASGGALKVDTTASTRVQLLIAIVDPPSPIIKYRRRYGVCTRYIAALEERQTISVGIQPGYLDVNSSELEVPVVLIGPGTGLAPMRSMIHERAVWAENQHRAKNTSLEGDMLFFGCRTEKSDYFFHDEWESFAKDNSLTVRTAFSRDQDKPRQYVQDQIRSNGAQVYEALVQCNGKVYVCGSSGNMPKGVREALIDVLAEHGSLSAAEAESYLQQMEKSGRYKQETW
jgi:sulfite reductase alpha subunit-like flavoprotein